MITRPILFSGAMVRALLDRTKTQTRRVVKGQMLANLGDLEHVPDWIMAEVPHACPYGQPGDRLWVRETFGYVSPDEFERPHAECNIEYRADLPLGCTDRPGSWPADECAGDPARPRWRPSIHMPRAASRILLEIVSVRVERLQDISEGDSWAEGVDKAEVLSMPCADGATAAYSALWQRINGPGSWEANPWVWVVEFKRVAP